MHIQLLLLLVLVLVTFSSAHKADTGSCPRVTPMDNFDLDKFMGTWYVLYKVKTGSSCVTNLFYYDGDSKDAKVTEERFMDTKVGDGVVHLTSDLITTGSIPSIMKIEYHNALPKSTVRIMATDYNNYAMIFKCQNWFFFHRWSVSILSRDPNYQDDKVLRSLFAKMESEDLDSSLLDKIYHSGCKNADQVDLAVTFNGDDFNLDVDGKYVDTVKDTLDTVGDVVKDVAEVAAREVLKKTADNKDNELVEEGLM